MKKSFIIIFILMLGISLGAKAQISDGHNSYLGFSQISPSNGTPGTHTAIIHCTQPRTVTFYLISGGFSASTGQAECYFKVGGNIVYHTKINTTEGLVSVPLRAGDNYVEVGMMNTAGGISISGTYLNVLMRGCTPSASIGSITGISDTALYFTN